MYGVHHEENHTEIKQKVKTLREPRLVEVHLPRTDELNSNHAGPQNKSKCSHVGHTIHQRYLSRQPVVRQRNVQCRPVDLRPHDNEGTRHH